MFDFVCIKHTILCKNVFHMIFFKIIIFSFIVNDMKNHNNKLKNKGLNLTFIRLFKNSKTRTQKLKTKTRNV